MRAEWVPRSASIVIVDGSGKHYIGACQVHDMGEYLYLHTLIAKAFYEWLINDKLDFFISRGYKVVQLDIDDLHLILIRRKLGSVLDIEVRGPNRINGVDLNRVEMRLKNV